MTLREINNQTNSTPFNQIEKSYILYKSNLLGLSLETAEDYSCVTGNLADLEYSSNKIKIQNNNKINYLPSLLVYNFLSQDAKRTTFHRSVASQVGFNEFSNTVVIKNLFKYYNKYKNVLQSNILFYNLRKKIIIVYIFELQYVYTIKPFLFFDATLKKDKDWSKKVLQQYQKKGIKKSKSIFLLATRKFTENSLFSKTKLIQFLHLIQKRFKLKTQFNILKSESEYLEALQVKQPIFMLLYHINEKKIGTLYKFKVLNDTTFYINHYFNLALLSK